MTLNYNFIILFYIVLNVVSFRLTDHGEREHFRVQDTVHDGTDVARS
jgi:hypothetical protein